MYTCIRPRPAHSAPPPRPLGGSGAQAGRPAGQQGRKPVGPGPAPPLWCSKLEMSSCMKHLPLFIGVLFILADRKPPAIYPIRLEPSCYLSSGAITHLLFIPGPPQSDLLFILSGRTPPAIYPERPEPLSAIYPHVHHRNMYIKVLQDSMLPIWPSPRDAVILIAGAISAGSIWLGSSTVVCWSLFMTQSFLSTIYDPKDFTGIWGFDPEHFTGQGDGGS